jgi:hypothetical protein
MLQVFIAGLAFVAALLHVAFSAKQRSGAAAMEGTYLIYPLFIYVGLMGLFTAYGGRTYSGRFLKGGVPWPLETRG